MFHFDMQYKTGKMKSIYKRESKGTANTGTDKSSRMCRY